MRAFLLSLLHSQDRISYRRLVVTALAGGFAAYALLAGVLDAVTWGWFTGALCATYIGGDTVEKFAALKGR